MIAIDIADAELSERLFASLTDVPGLRLARPGEAADVRLGPPTRPVTPMPDTALTRANSRCWS